MFEKDLDKALEDFQCYLKNIGLDSPKADGVFAGVAVDSRKHFSSEVFDRRKYFMHCFISYLAKLNEVSVFNEVVSNFITRWLKYEDMK